MSELERRVAQLLEMRKRAAAASDPEIRGELMRKASDLALVIRALAAQTAARAS